MTDEPTTCPECSESVPSGAAFCPSCGHRMAAAPEAPASSAPPAQRPPGPATDPAPAAEHGATSTGPAPWVPPDATQVDGPALHDPTQVQPAAAPPAPAPPAAPPSAPWAPPSSAAPTGPATTAPWNPPSAPPAPAWAQPSAPPSFGAPPPPPAGWAAPGSGQGAFAPSAATAPVATKAAGSTFGGAAALVGAVLVVAGVFLGWVNLDVGGTSETVTGWSLVGGEGRLKSDDPYLLLGLAAAAAVVGVLLFTGLARTLVRVAAAAVGVGVVVVAALNWFSIADFVSANLSSSDEVTTAIGFYVAIAGGVVVALASLLPVKR